MRVSPRMLIKFSMPSQGGPMVWPYTWGAKVARMDYAYHWKMNWSIRFTTYGAIAFFPVIFYIDSMVNSPAAKANYKKMKKLEAEKHHEEHRWADISGKNAKR